MVNRNANVAQLKSGYLFPEIRKRKDAYLKEFPEANIISLGIGDTTEPLTLTAVEGIHASGVRMGQTDGFRGYPPENGDLRLRELIAEKLYKNLVDQEDIFISDGSKCDVGRLQVLFGSAVSIAVQDPVYPVYVDTGKILGQNKIVLMPCTPDNCFFPDEFPPVDIIFFCSPNNPTGAAATYEQLTKLVNHAKQTKAIIIYDAAYAAFMQQQPRSIYEIPGADQVAIEMGSFSKMAGFTGMRLGWTVVPKQLKFNDGSSVKQDWHRIVSTFFNGASWVTSDAACNLLTDKGMKEIKDRVAFYLENATIMNKTLNENGYSVFGGVNIPYLWISKRGAGSWELFDFFLRECRLLTIPGSGFGPSGEGFVRMSAFAHREDIIEAVKRIKEVHYDIIKRCDSECYI